MGLLDKMKVTGLKVTGLGKKKGVLEKTPDLEAKKSSVGSMVAYNTLGNPIWTPRNYEALTREGYLKNVIVYRCVNLISRGAASVPWRLYDGDNEVVTHPLLKLLQRPSAHESGSAFMESLIGYLLLSGNSYVEAVSGDEAPEELYVLRPDRMKVIPHETGVAAGYEYSVGGHNKIINVDSMTMKSPILHLKLFNPLSDWYGMSPIEAAACSIDQHNSVAGHNLSILQNGGRPSGALMMDSGGHGFISDDQLAEIRESLRETVEGENNAGRVLVMEGNFKWQEMGLSPKDLDFIEGKHLSAREIAQAFSVPPMLVGVTGDATFANYKEARFHLWEDTILPLLDYVTDELNAWLVSQFGENFRLAYDVEGIAALAPRREEVWAKIGKADFLTLNEKRKAVGYGPLENGKLSGDYSHSKKVPV